MDQPHGSVLLVDDDESVLIVLGRTLTKAGFRVTAVSSTEQAMADLKLQTFAAVICDLSVGGGRNTLDFLYSLRLVQPRIAVLLITGFATPEIVAEAEEKRIEILEKPFDPNQLVEKVGCLVKRSKHSAA